MAVVKTDTHPLEDLDSMVVSVRVCFTDVVMTVS